MKKAKIFLAHSIRNKLESKEVIPLIIQTLEKAGYTVFSDHVTKMSQNQLDSFTRQENIAYHRKIFQNIHKANLVISECSKESLSVGFLLAFALENVDTRLNFYLPAEMSNYLKLKCKHKGLTKSAYLRLLLEDSISRDTDF
ncbi:MAG: hypothetical protein COY81_05255 [Candidatus Pacebacteria bacterium CG_4_10_14_0_8_um_filter_43_12]|nr:MAG: hypothetical protein COY81_05255 [Candidatus Pacebacteria bacterium CG_4_10_14_0_8_um_filter_43_12]